MKKITTPPLPVATQKGGPQGLPDQKLTTKELDTLSRMIEERQLLAYFRAAHPAARSFAWDLLQTAPTERNRAAFLAVGLAFDLLANEEEEGFSSEPLPSVGEVVAGFQRGTVGVMDTRELIAQLDPEQWGAITAAALALFNLGKPEEETEQHLSRV